MGDEYSHYLSVTGPAVALDRFLRAEFGGEAGAASPPPTDPGSAGWHETYGRFCEEVPAVEPLVESSLLLVYKFVAPLMLGLDLAYVLSCRHRELHMTWTHEHEEYADAGLKFFYGGEEVGHVHDRVAAGGEDWPDVIYPDGDDEDLPF